jgi:hypothetical protein
MRKIAKIAAIAVFAAAGFIGAAVPAHAAQQQHGGACHKTTALGMSGSVCIGTQGGSIVARASFTSDGPMLPVPVRVCVVIYNADIGPVGGTCKHVGPGTTVTVKVPRRGGIFVADAFILRPFWLDFGPTPALTV